MKSVRNNSAGFSLVELMVVVAIIGILATIAVPQVNKFMAKARQSEAKANLSTLYSAQKAFKAEYNTYFAGFQVVGFSPEGKLRYTVGFAGRGGVTSANLIAEAYPQGAAAINAAHTNSDGYCRANPANCTELTDAIGAGWNGWRVQKDEFTATASSNNIGMGALDRWTITHTKDMQNPRSGIN